MFGVLNPTFMRPHSEYWVQVASACFKYEADILERVQRGGTKMIKSPLGLSYVGRLRRLNLSYCGLGGDLISAHRILNSGNGNNVLSFPSIQK